MPGINKTLSELYLAKFGLTWQYGKYQVPGLLVISLVKYIFDYYYYSNYIL